MLAKLRSLFSVEQTEDENVIETDLAAASLMLEVCWRLSDAGEHEDAFVSRQYQVQASTIRTEARDGFLTQ